jgi:hypothetical protein
MQEGGKEIIGQPAPAPAAPLDYALPTKDRHRSVWPVAGFGLAGVCLIGAAVQYRQVWSMLRGGATQAGIGVSPIGFLILLPPICHCLISLRRGRKLLAIAGIGVGLIALIAMIVVVAGSPWR